MKTPLLLIAAFTTLVLGCQAEADLNPPSSAIPVKTVQIQRANMSFPVRTVGTLTRDTEMNLSFKIGGIVDRIAVSEGQKVKKGQLLASLKTTEIHNQVLQTKNALEKAERDFQRIKELYADKVATLEQYQNLETALNIARSNYNISQFNLAHAKIIAPQNGVVLHKFSQINELVSPGQPIVALSSTQSKWKIRAGIADKYISHIRMGDSAAIEMDAYPNHRFSGKVSLVGAGANPRTGMFEIEVALNPTPTKLFSGLIGSVDIFPTKKQPVAIIPIEALHNASGMSGTLFIPSPDGKRAVQKEVGIVHIASKSVAISKGLEDAQTVITDGSAYLSEGSSIQEMSEGK